MTYYFKNKKEYLKTYLKAFLNKKDSSGVHEYIDLGILNPSIGTSNMGDFIIYEAVLNEIKPLLPKSFITNYPTQINTNFEAKAQMSQKDFLLVSGTNLLSSNIDVINQFKVDPGHRIFLKNKVLLFGVGWWQYQKGVNKYTKKMYKSIFNDQYLHSVRDAYTEQKLKSIGINNVVNTSCPTMWNLTPQHCLSIPKGKSKDVVTTLTFYHANPELDKRMLEILVENYENVYLWIQSLHDIKYLRSIFQQHERIKFVDPDLGSYDEILSKKNIEYLGSRLHAGVRAIQKGVRTLIVAVDNRALEISKDTNLNVIERARIEQVYNFINNDYTTDICLPQENIDKWRNSIGSLKLT